MSFFSKISNIFGSSIKSINGMFSHTKISSYFILLSILGSSLTFLIIEIGNARLEWGKENIYEIPINHIGLFAMILSHHLILLGLKNSNDKIMIGDVTLNGKKDDEKDKKESEAESEKYPEA